MARSTRSSSPPAKRGYDGDLTQAAAKGIGYFCEGNGVLRRPEVRVLFRELEDARRFFTLLVNLPEES